VGIARCAEGEQSVSQKDATFLFDHDERILLDPSSPVPLYHQMEEIIYDRIQGEGTVGRMLPAEKDLMVIFDVSRATVKKTLDNLVNKGLIERRRALGTKVMRQEITEKLARLTSYTEEMEAKNLSVRSNILDVRLHRPSEEVREKLQLAEDAQTLCVRRLRGTNKVYPVVLLQSELSPVLSISPEEDFNGSLYQLIEKKYGARIEWAEEVIRARKADADEARHLEIGEGEPVLAMERLTFTTQNRPIELVTAVYRAEHFKYSIRLGR
jgi:GntR family transcriptional regulator